MAQQINDAVLAGNDGLQQMIIATGIEETGGPFDGLFPGI
jgi:hypothetical protein